MQDKLIMQKLSILSWNIQGNWNLTGHTLFSKVKPRLASSTVDIIALQEMCNAKRVLDGMPELRGYNVFIPKLNGANNYGRPGFNHNVVLSKHPIIRAEEVNFPKWTGQNLEGCTRVDIRLQDEVLRLYDCHFGIFRVGIATRLKQLWHILEDSRGHRGPVVVCGDMNVTIPKAGWSRRIIRLWHQEPLREMLVDGKLIECDEREIFNQALIQHGFKEALDLRTTTWSPFKSEAWEMFNLKLDWFLVKGLEVEEATLGEYLSDHRAVGVQCRVQAPAFKALPKVRPRGASIRS